MVKWKSGLKVAYLVREKDWASEKREEVGRGEEEEREEVGRGEEESRRRL